MPGENFQFTNVVSCSSIQGLFADPDAIGIKVSVLVLSMLAVDFSHSVKPMASRQIELKASEKPDALRMVSH